MNIKLLIQSQHHRRSLRSRIILGLISYLIILTAGVLSNDFVVNERAEELVWDSSLNSEMDYLLERKKNDPDYQWPNTDSIAMFALDAGNNTHAPLINLPPGIHDEFIFNGKMWVILIRNMQEQSIALLLNIDNLEQNERKIENTIFLAAGAVSVALCIFVAWASGWLVRPLKEVARQIKQLVPDKKNQHVILPADSSIELEIIADAMNTYISRNERFIERERDFINMASHELRTPLSVIDGLVKLSLDDTDLPDNTKNRLYRINDTINNVHEMITLLLVLAKDPARVQESSELIFLDQIMLEIITEHAFLAETNNVAIASDKMPKTEIFAPLHMVKCALGNILRNAIENSHGGEIFVTLNKDSTVTIKNRNNQLSMKEISELYSRLARTKGRNGGGLGLDLISRLCTHCNWTLTFTPDPEAVAFSIKFS